MLAILKYNILVLGLLARVFDSNTSLVWTDIWCVYLCIPVCRLE